jgi:hypothetical protein
MTAKAMGTVQAAGCAKSAPTHPAPIPPRAIVIATAAITRATAGEQTGGADPGEPPPDAEDEQRAKRCSNGERKPDDVSHSMR